MGQHKFESRLPLATRWIICVKKFEQKMKPFVLTEEQKHAKEAPKIKPEYDQIPYWTPIGTPVAPDKRGNHSGIPFSYSSKEEAIDDLNRIIAIKFEEDYSDTLFAVLEVRYVPGHTKVHRQYWFDKYVKTETLLKIDPNKKIMDTFKEN